MTKYQCSKCGKITAGRRVRLTWNKGVTDHGVTSYRYNTDWRYPRKHKINGEYCIGSFMEAQWIDDQTTKSGAMSNVNKT